MAGTPPSSISTGGAGAMTQISDSTLSGTAASFDIQNISGGYSHLRLIAQLRGDNASATVLWLRLNNDSGSNYNAMQGVAQGGVAVGTPPTTLGVAQIAFGICADVSATANRTSNVVIEIPNYAGTTFHKSVVIINTMGTSDAANGQIIYALTNGTWKSAAAVTRVTLLPSAGNFIAGSRCTLYGLT